NTGKTYNQIRFKIAKFLSDKGFLDDERRRGLIRLNNALKSAISNQQNIFEGLSIRYFGPFDGHDINELVRLLEQLKDMKGPKLLHLHTQKGHGYAPAEKNAIIWHAPGKFEIGSGERIVKEDPNNPPKFQTVFGETLLELARKNPKIVGVTPAMPTGCSMNIMMKAMPERVFDVGIAEGHAITFSAGMAKDGMIPFCNIYSSFSQRAYDNIIHDVAILSLPVVICLDRSGLVGEDGVTHHGLFDIAALRAIPNLTIASPLNEHELRNLMYSAQTDGYGPIVIRYPRGRGVMTSWRNEFKEIKKGTSSKLKDGKDIAILSLGPIGNNAIKAIELVEKENPLISIAHFDMRFVKPLDEEALKEICKKYSFLITIEDGVVSAGFGSAVLEWIEDHNLSNKVIRLGVKDNFIEHGTVEELQKIAGIDVDAIKETINKCLSEIDSLG
ncbi:MAG: 1-deoxy-D-xylulose-5-phosphate synthase, partial [Prevotella sp.]|nr:1-deoxy-D-xylulose-5-phosphate synthase [Prevotella sp.]